MFSLFLLSEFDNIEKSDLRGGGSKHTLAILISKTCFLQVDLSMCLQVNLTKFLKVDLTKFLQVDLSKFFGLDSHVNKEKQALYLLL